MNKTDAAKLAQAYQWLADGKEVECLTHGQWSTWDGWIRAVDKFRIKPEPKLVPELWVNFYENGLWASYPSRQSALDNVCPETIQAAVHMREVREPDIEGMAP